GSYLSEYFARHWSAQHILWLIAGMLILSGAISPFLSPLVARIVGSDSAIFTFLSRSSQNAWLISSPAFFLVAMLLGSVLPLLCRLSISADRLTGRHVSFIYAANILGSVLGSIGIGFVLMQYLGLKAIALSLALVSIAVGGFILFSGPS